MIHSKTDPNRFKLFNTDTSVAIWIANQGRISTVIVSNTFRITSERNWRRCAATDIGIRHTSHPTGRWTTPIDCRVAGGTVKVNYILTKWEISCASILFKYTISFWDLRSFVADTISTVGSTSYSACNAQIVLDTVTSEGTALTAVAVSPREYLPDIVTNVVKT